MRQSMREWLVLIAGLSLMLSWAGIMEAFFSQHHEPELPYAFKVAIGGAETDPAHGISAGDRAKKAPCPFGGKMTNARPIRLGTTAELTIATPEGVLFRLPLAGPASRLYAMLLDVAIVLAAVNGLGLLVYWIFSKAPGFGVM